MSRIPAGKVLVKAGQFLGGKMPILTYVGQIKPADVAKIIWYGAEGDDTTGDGTHATPYETFEKALSEFSSLAHKWILRTDLGEYGSPDPGPYITDSADRVYLDPTRPDDSGDGLTPATAKKTYGAAKTALTGSGRSVIHCIGSFTLTDVIDAPTQGEIGETLTLNAASSVPAESVLFSGTGGEGKTLNGIVETPTHLVAIGYNNGTAAAIVMRSADNGASWSTAEPAWANGIPRDIATDGVTIVVVKDAGASDTQAAYSTDNGTTWNLVTIVAGGAGMKVVYSGSLFVAIVYASLQFRVYTSPDGASWTLRNSAARDVIGTDGEGRVLICLPSSAIYSTDHGVTWGAATAVPVIPGSNSARCIVYGGGLWHVFTFGTDPRYFTAADPTGSWQAVTVSFDYTNRRVARAVYSDSLGGVIAYQNNLAAGTSKLRFILSDGSSQSFQTISTGLEGYEPGLLIAKNGGERILAAGGQDSTLVRTISAVAISIGNIQSSLINAEVDDSKNAAIGPSGSAEYITAEPTSGVSVETLNDAALQYSKAVSANDSALKHKGDKLRLRRNVIKGNSPAVISGKAVIQDDIELSQNTIIGDVTLSNSGGTDKELIQDNIIEGNFTAAAPVTVRSNIRGAVVNAGPASKISTINPLFADEIDYMLSRVAFGQNFDSPLAVRSVTYSYDHDGETFKDDLGPYRVFSALLRKSYKRAFYLPKASREALSEDIENSASLLRSINGVPDVSNRPDARVEVVSWQSKTVGADVREFISYMEREKNCQVELYYDFDESVYDQIEVDGAHASGTFEVNIVPRDVPVGAVLLVGGERRYVVQRFPRAGEAEKLVLDDVLTGGLSDGELITVEQVQGAGEFVFVPEQKRQNLRVFSRRRDTYKGMRYTFVRKAL